MTNGTGTIGGVRQYFGKYRGKVVNNIDPLTLGRLQVSVPAVYGTSSVSWALPSVPYAGAGVGLFLLPPIDANVWVEFEGGDPDSPIWGGVFWDDTQRPPASPPTPLVKTLTMDGLTITVDDAPGAGQITIESAAGAKIVLGLGGIEIDNGQGASIKLQGPAVSINNGALEVT